MAGERRTVKMLRLNGVVWLIILLGVCFLGVINYRKIEALAQSEPYPTQTELKPFSPEDITKLENTVARLRGLPFKNHVKVGILSKKELRQKMQESYEKEEAKKEMPKTQKALAKLGLIPPGLDLTKLMVDVLTEEIGGFYDPETKELYVIKPGEEEIPPEAVIIENNFGVPYGSFTSAHELTHALQDQNYGIMSLPKDNPENDDIYYAVDALIEGDPSYLMYDYLFHQVGRDLSLVPITPKETDYQPPLSGNLLDESPAYIRETLLFPYTWGLTFVHRVKSTGGWNAVNKMYDRLPSSTEQIMHPEKYLSDPPDNPITVTLPDLSKWFPPEHYELLQKNVIGEFTLSILLREFLPNIKTEKLAEGWGGDQYVIFEQKPAPLPPSQQEQVKMWVTKLGNNGANEQKEAEKELRTTGNAAVPFLQPVKEKAEEPEYKKRLGRLIGDIQNRNCSFVWFLTWDTLPDADKFYNAYYEVLGKKYAQAKITEQTPANGITKTVWRDEENLNLLEKRGKDILVLETVTENTLSELEPFVWKEVKKEELKGLKRKQPEKKQEEKTPEKPNSGGDKK